MDFEIGKVDSFTTGTVGPKGKRTFFLQATSGGTTVSLKLEKGQVLAMAEHLANLLEDLPEIGADEWTSAPALIEPVNQCGSWALWAPCTTQHRTTSS